MRVAAFGEATRAGGVGLLAAGLASLTLGLYVYSAFLLFARAYYALGDSKTPAMVAIAAAVVGIGVMALGGALTSGDTTVAIIGLGHTSAYAVGSLVLGVGLARRTGRSIAPRGLARAVLIAAPIGVGMWAAVRALEPSSRLANLAAVVVAVLVG